MTITERFKKIDIILEECEGTVGMSIAVETAAQLIAQLIDICREQEEQINTLIEYVTELQLHTGNDNARINRLERVIADKRQPIDSDLHTVD